MSVVGRLARGCAIAGCLAAVGPLASSSSAVAAPCATPNVYPGDAAPKHDLAVWMARGARDRGLPGELPVMGALVESGMKNLNYGGSDSVGFFQMRTSIWNQGEYAGYPEDPDLQLEWFIDRAIIERERAAAAGDLAYGVDPSRWGEWAADVLRPAEQNRGRYQVQLGPARELIGELCTNPTDPADEPPTCRGLTATVIGTGERDELTGSPEDDVILALGGGDRIRGAGGEDVVCGGGGDDRLAGGGGRDRLFGEAGDDVLKGGPGRDVLKGGPGRDRAQQ